MTSLVCRCSAAPTVECMTAAQVRGFSCAKSTAAMSHDYTASKSSLECMFGLGALGKIKSQNRSASKSSWRKLDVKITCGDWYTIIWCLTIKRVTSELLGMYQVSNDKNTNP
ncbi:hypothetical protein TNCV_4764411 [Trichonephila clavipes]|nr:hypothetical protein TNCV_4764411 [Trichonephila clavipes]